MTRCHDVPHARKYFPFRNLEGTHAELSSHACIRKMLANFDGVEPPYAIAVALARRGDD